MDKKTVFISYSQKDKDKVSLFANLLSQNNFNIWIDTKDIAYGEHIISSISKGLEQSDIYMLFVSTNSLKSKWVNEEFNIALTKNIENDKPKIIPVVLDECEIPNIISSRLYVDASKSINNALNQINKFISDKGISSKEITFPNKPVLTSVTFGIEDTTNISVGPFCGDFTKDDLISDLDRIKKDLRKKANGILLNFIPLSDFDLQSPIPKFTNGIYEEDIITVQGDTTSSICKKAIINTTVFNPNNKKLLDLINNNLETLDVNSLSYIFSIPFQSENFDKKCMQYIQDNYSILSYDFESGATISYGDDIILSIKCNPEQIKITVTAEYSFLFHKKGKIFSPENFIENLIKHI